MKLTCGNTNILEEPYIDFDKNPWNVWKYMRNSSIRFQVKVTLKFN